LHNKLKEYGGGSAPDAASDKEEQTQ
jgi:hypothetical protein